MNHQQPRLDMERRASIRNLGGERCENGQRCPNRVTKPEGPARLPPRFPSTRRTATNQSLPPNPFFFHQLLFAYFASGNIRDSITPVIYPIDCLLRKHYGGSRCASNTVSCTPCCCGLSPQRTVVHNPKNACSPILLAATLRAIDSIHCGVIARLRSYHRQRPLIHRQSRFPHIHSPAQSCLNSSRQAPLGCNRLQATFKLFTRPANPCVIAYLDLDRLLDYVPRPHVIRRSVAAGL